MYKEKHKSYFHIFMGACIFASVTSRGEYLNFHECTCKGCWVSSSVTIHLVSQRKGLLLSQKLTVSARLALQQSWAFWVSLVNAVVTGTHSHVQVFIRAGHLNSSFCFQSKGSYPPRNLHSCVFTLLPTNSTAALRGALCKMLPVSFQFTSLCLSIQIIKSSIHFNFIFFINKWETNKHFSVSFSIRDTFL